MNKNFIQKTINKIKIIAPEKKYVKFVQRALILIKKTDLKEYDKLKSRLAIIFITRRKRYTNEFIMPEKIWFTNNSIYHPELLIDLASGLIHEGVHATQYKNGRYIYDTFRLEKEAINSQKKFLKKLNQETKYLDDALKKNIGKRFKRMRLVIIILGI